MRHYQNRREEPRSPARIEGQVRCRDSQTRGRVLNLSPGGVCIELRSNIGASQGAPIVLDTDAVGLLQGIVHWSRGDRIGIRLERSSNAAAKINSYFRLFAR